MLVIIRNREEAEDVVMEAFLILYNKRDTIRDEDHLVNYLSRVARNKAICYLRRLKTRQKAESSWRYWRMTIERDYVGPEEEEATFALRRSRLLFAVESLPERRKLIVMMRYFCSTTTGVIARRLGLNEQTVRNQLSRAKVTLRRDKIILQ